MKCLKKKRKILCKKSKGKIITSTKLFLVLVFFCLTFAFKTNPTLSYSIEPAIEEFLLNISQEASSSVNFTNTTQEEQRFSIYTHRYNPVEQEILDERNFLEVKTTSLSLEPEETAEIEYLINIPEDILPGSYFSIIVVEGLQDEDVQQRGGFGLNYGIGTLIAIHVVDDIDISDIFLNQTQTTLRYKRPLNPFNTVIEYSIRNNSKYTFLPTGQLTIASEKEKPVFYQINEDEKRLHPEDRLTFEFEYKGNIKDLFDNKKAIAKIASQYSNELKEDEIEIPYLTQTLRIGGVVIGSLAILTASILLIKRNQRKTLEKMFKDKISKKN